MEIVKRFILFIADANLIPVNNVKKKETIWKLLSLPGAVS